MDKNSLFTLAASSCISQVHLSLFSVGSRVIFVRPDVFPPEHLTSCFIATQLTTSLFCYPTASTASHITGIRKSLDRDHISSSLRAVSTLRPPPAIRFKLRCISGVSFSLCKVVLSCSSSAVWLAQLLEALSRVWVQIPPSSKRINFGVLPFLTRFTIHQCLNTSDCHGAYQNQLLRLIKMRLHNSTRERSCYRLHKDEVVMQTVRSPVASEPYNLFVVRLDVSQRWVSFAIIPAHRWAPFFWKSLSMALPSYFA